MVDLKITLTLHRKKKIKKGCLFPHSFINNLIFGNLKNKNPPGYFAVVILEMGVSQTISQGWPQP
jgi:hypothetical protein